MKVNPNIFRAYDIRGIYPKEVNEKVAYSIGRAYVKFLGKKSPNIVVGRDGRLSSFSLFKALVGGIVDQGANVINIGLSSTPMFYFSVAHFKFDGGINITGSHLPAERNGFKLVREKAIPISEKSGIREIKKIATKGQFGKSKKGKILEKRILSKYIKFNLKDFNFREIKPFKIAIDTANAVSSILIPVVFKKTNCKIYHLFAELDGTFPNHPPDPHIEENLKSLKREVLRKQADLGIAFDGDGDRVVFIDEKGERIPGDSITSLLTTLILKENPGEKILCDIRSSNIVREVVKAAGGKPILGRIGHAFIKEKMRKENIIFQGELNGHYYFREHYFTEAPFLAIFRILEEISKRGENISKLVKPFKKYFFSGEINFKVKNKKRILGNLEKKYKGGKASHLDGLRVDYSDWWFNVRPSHTEPLLRLVVEAKTKKLMEKKKKEIITLITV